MSIENRYQAARDRFFADNPRALTQIESVNPAVIEACGIMVDGSYGSTKDGLVSELQLVH